MRNKSLLYLILAFLCPIFAIGQNISVTGKTNVPNALVRLLTYDEMLTCHQTKVAETQSDNDGNFTLKAEIKEITPAQIAINLERIDIVLNPGGNYSFEITIPEQKEGSYFEKEQPSLKVNALNDDDFYMQFVAVQSFVDYFLYENFDQIYRGKNISLLDTLDNQLVRNVGVIKHQYTKDFVKYRKAAVMMTVNVKKTVSEYIDNQEVLYSQAAYMDVLTEMMASLGRDNDFLSRNWQIAEIFTMLKLKMMYYGNPNAKNHALTTLENIEKSSKSLKNRLVAKNIASQITELSYDSNAPAFSLRDKNGKITKLSDYQGDMVLIQFVDRITPLTGQEFSMLNDLHKQWNDTIKLVTIATKESFDDYVQLFDNQHYNWQLLNLDDNILLLEAYHVKTYPAYVILKRKNRIGMAPAPSPNHYLDAQVRRISKYL